MQIENHMALLILVIKDPPGKVVIKIVLRDSTISGLHWARTSDLCSVKAAL
jgi:hypothetical protein